MQVADGGGLRGSALGGCGGRGGGTRLSGRMKEARASVKRVFMTISSGLRGAERTATGVGARYAQRNRGWNELLE